ncbi:MAG TPA: DUF3558 family protein [Candidatus Dormibacteraeota bacterium]|nr:DUF3558 family protein [Candidatus Dormibacteraeota bacterium]
MFRRLGLFVVIGGLVVTACSGSGSPATTAPGGGGGSPSGAPSQAGSSGTAAAGPLDPCQLLTQAEVATATGVAVGPGTSLNDGLMCRWEYADPSDQLSGIDASLTVDTDDTAFKEEQQGSSLSKAASGIGDEAYYLDSPLATILTFKKGAYLFDVTMNVAGNMKDTFTIAKQEAVEKAMALAAIPRIP